jgi:Uncharacterised nucleotidyltransferase
MSRDLFLSAVNAGVIPTANQTLLLKACLYKGAPSYGAFMSWMEDLGFSLAEGKQDHPGLVQVYDRLDLGSQRLLSLLYKNLYTQGFRHPVIDALGGYYKFIWYKNQILKSHLQSVIADLQLIQVDAIAFKGIVQIEKYYENSGSRPTADIDLVVRPGDVQKTVDILLAKGWTSRSDPFRIGQSQFHAHQFFLQKIELDLHFHFSAFPLEQKTELSFWEQSTRVTEGYRVLTPAHELFCILLHALQWNQIPPIRWVADSVLLTDRFDDDEWHKFHALVDSENYGFAGQLMKYLVDNRFVAPPQHVMNLLQSKRTDVSILPQINFALTPRNENEFANVLRLIAKIKYTYKHGTRQWLKAWVDHSLYYWNIKDHSELLRFGIGKVATKTIIQTKNIFRRIFRRQIKELFY